MNLNEEQIERYSRHIILKDVGGKGQEKLLNSKVLIIGAGGLGAPAALYLAAAGVGTLGIVDGDVVDLSNLQRQVIHFTPDVGKAKVDSAREKINLVNPDVTVIPYNERVYAENISDIIADYDFIIDGTDNFPAKFLVNDAAVMNGKPFSHAGILRFYGQTITHVPGKACYRCLFDSPPPKGSVPSCSEAGILGVVAGILGTIQAAEAIRYILGIGELLTDSLLHYDAYTMDFRKIKVKKNPNCKVCSEDPEIRELKDYEQPVCDLAAARP
ncbi:MAG: molybdopterin-synthase adenylyltransferase MoeB [bacterium]|nr:molybdopterin-synthase adenylyltransferase MoeB [bacterium]